MDLSTVNLHHISDKAVVIISSMRREGLGSKAPKKL